MSGATTISSPHVWFVVAIMCGLSANIGLMQLNKMHRGCANTCTLFQFGFGLVESLLDPNKRKFLLDSKERKLALPYHAPRFRSLGPPSQRKGPSFYRSRRDATRTQERILRDSAHTNATCSADDFWCGKPPQ